MSRRASAVPAKFAIIAPIAPFRGGIAQHSTAIARAFDAMPDCRIEAETFSTLYPRAIYPGASDRDPDSPGQHPFPTRALISTINPLSWYKAAARIVRSCPDVAIIPAWTFFVAPALGWIARRLRTRGIAVVMIVHNASDHESKGWKSRLLDWQLSAADGFVTHTRDLARQLAAAGHAQPATVTAHPAFIDFPAPKGTLKRERGLELLCFGLVRRYKGVDIALEALEASGLSDVRLTIAGEIWEDGEMLRQLMERPGLRGKIELIDRYISDEEAAELFNRCDAVLAPYRAVTGSGVAALARRYRRPVIAPNLPGFSEAIASGKTGWLVAPSNTQDYAHLLGSSVTRAAAAAMQGDLERAAGEDGWHGYCQAILDLAVTLKHFPKENP